MTKKCAKVDTMKLTTMDTVIIWLMMFTLFAGFVACVRYVPFSTDPKSDDWGPPPPGIGLGL